MTCNNKVKELISWITHLSVGIMLVILITRYILIFAYIPSGSMIPTLNIGDRVFCTSLFFNSELETGDIVVFTPNKEFNEKYFIKRVVGTPGDLVELKNGTVYVNGKKLKEGYDKSSLYPNGSFAVPPDKYFVMGDNRNESLDARFWQNPYIDKNQIKFVAHAVVFPFKDAKILTY